ncbi:hypothetical protein L204_100261 [Cryptococcus depauperatus]|nr:hypothetical protein L204_02261 [Cryptococcus depauperatus CBS 7855]
MTNSHPHTANARSSLPPPYRLSPSPNCDARESAAVAVGQTSQAMSLDTPVVATPTCRLVHRRSTSFSERDDPRWLSEGEGSATAIDQPNRMHIRIEEQCSRRPEADDVGPSTRAYRGSADRSQAEDRSWIDGADGQESLSGDGSHSHTSGRKTLTLARARSPVLATTEQCVRSDFGWQPESEPHDRPLASPSGFLDSVGPGAPSIVSNGKQNNGNVTAAALGTTLVAQQPRDASAEGNITKNEGRETIMQALKSIFTCPNCPIQKNKNCPLYLHHPVTLPCGHTLSLTHLDFPSLPLLPPVQFTTDPAELWSSQQRRHQQNLSLWASVSCKIPSCKRYLGQETTISNPTSQAQEADGGSSRSMGVPVFPPPPLPTPILTASQQTPAFSLDLANDALPPAYSVDDNQRAPLGVGLLDTRVEKMLEIFRAEKEKIRLNKRQGRRRNVDATWSDLSSSSDDEADRENEQRHLGSTSDSPTSPSARRSMKRRRRHQSLVLHFAQNEEEWPFKKELMATLECGVCAQMLYQPVTTPCQHSFCTKCLSRSLDHSPRCPVCRQDLPSFTYFQDHPQSKVLLFVLTTVFPEEYAERRASLDAEERNSLLSTPIFVCTLAFPGMPTILHVFEPRYRLMIRRCIESNSPRFGMILPARGAGLQSISRVMEYGTMLEIQSVQMLPDGRSIVETVGTHRFKLLEKGSLDGYTVGRIERMDDISPEEEAEMEREAVERRSRTLNATLPAAPVSTPISRTPSHQAPAMEASASAPGILNPDFSSSILQGMDFASLAAQSHNPSAAPSQSSNRSRQSSNAPSPENTPESTEELMSICRAFIEQLRSGFAPWLLQRLNNTYGTMPDNPSEFSYWMALVMPIDEYEKARLLPIRSPRLRLKLIVHWVESFRSSWWFSNGCVVG